MNTPEAPSTVALPQGLPSAASQDPRREYQESIATVARLSTQFRRQDPAWEFAITRFRNSLFATIIC